MLRFVVISLLVNATNPLVPVTIGTTLKHASGMQKENVKQVRRVVLYILVREMPHLDALRALKIKRIRKTRKVKVLLAIIRLMLVLLLEQILHVVLRIPLKIVQEWVV